MAPEATIKQIAVLARVSTATVSHVVNGKANVSPKLRARVLKVIQDLNYRPNYLARSLRTRESNTVGMIIPSITNPFFPVQVRGVEDVLHRQGYNLILGISDYDLQREEMYYRTFMAKRVDGLILVITPTQAPDYLQRHDFDGTPVVFIDRRYQGLRGDTVQADSLAGSFEAVTHLLDMGHRRIGIITGPQGMLMARRRLLGYQGALRAKGLKPEEELIREGKFDAATGYEQGRALLALSPRPSAIFASSGMMAMGALRAIAEAKLRCPEDCALVSFDDLEWFGHMQPALTAVANPAFELGSTAADLLVQRMSGQVSGPPQRKVLKVKLLVRESSGAKSVGQAA